MTKSLHSQKQILCWCGICHPVVVRAKRCLKCKGSGKIHPGERLCPKCKGKGRIEIGR